VASSLPDAFAVSEATLPPQGFDHGNCVSFITQQLGELAPDGIIEPPILEFAASVAYLVLGGEHLWVPRLLSAAFWSVGGIFLYLIAKKLVCANAALLSVFFYLFVPFGIIASRAFMPDPLMIMLLLMSIFTVLRYHEQPSTLKLIIAALASSLTLFIKPMVCFFLVFGAYVSLLIYREGLRKTLFGSHLLAFAALSLVPVSLYYLYSALGEGFLEGQLQDKVKLGLLLHASFWKEWLFQVKIVVGYAALIGAILGALLFRSGLCRALMLGVWGGYFLFGLVFTSQISTHDYYSLQLIPVVALSLAPIGALVNNDPGRVELSPYKRVTVAGLLFLIAFLSAYEHRTEILFIGEQLQDDTYVEREYHGIPVAADYRDIVETYEEIGEVVDHSSHTLFLVPDEGFPLIYHGRLYGTWFPPPGVRQAPFWATKQTRRADKARVNPTERFNIVYSELSPEYFIVVTRFNLWGRPVNFLRGEQYKDLRNLLTEDFPVVGQGDDYLVFDLRLREKDR
jgi:hypothetical protein